MTKKELSESAAKKLQDLESLKSRYETYEINVNNSSLSEIDKLCAKVDSTMSVIEGLGARLLMTFVSQEEIQKLTDSLHSAAKNSRLILAEQKDQDKNSLSAAKTEAALKGFALPVVRDGNFEGLEQYNLTPEEIDIAFNTTKKALLAVADKKLPPEEYKTKIQEEYIKILQREHKFDSNKLDAFKNFAAQGVKSKQDKGITEAERKILTNSATKAYKEFKMIFEKNEKNIVKNPAFLTTNLTKELVKNFELGGKKISPQTKKKFSQLAGNILKNLGEDYLKENLGKVAEAMSREIDKNKTLLSGWRDDLRISSAKINKITSNINSRFKEEALNNINAKAKAQLAEYLGQQKTTKQANVLIPNKKHQIVQQARKVGNEIRSQQPGKKLTPPATLKTPPLALSKTNKPPGWAK